MARYTPAPAFERDVTSSLGMRSLMNQVATAVQRATVQGAPRRTGAYARSLTSAVVHERDGWHARVGSRSPFWHLVEFGSVNNPAYAPLRRGLERTVRRTERVGRGG